MIIFPLFHYSLDFVLCSFIGSVELASAGVSVSVFNVISKLFNIPLLSVATSFVAEDIAKSETGFSPSGDVDK